MRLIPIVALTLVASSPAMAQSWQEYAYPEYAFAMALPAAPQIENRTVQVAADRSVPARVYSVRQNNVILTMTVADLAGTNLQENDLIAQAVKSLSAGGKVVEDLPHRIYRVYGRQLSVEGSDGSHTHAAVFQYKDRLYQIEGKVLPAGIEFEAVRFQQSLTFTDSGSNRTEEWIRALRAGCTGMANFRNAAGNQPNPAGHDDPRCKVTQ